MVNLNFSLQFKIYDKIGILNVQVSRLLFFFARNFVVFEFGHLLHFYLLRYVLQHVFSFYKQVTMMMTIDVGYSELINEK